MNRSFVRSLLAASMLTPVAALAQVPTSPPVNFTNSTSINPGTEIGNLLDSYATLEATQPQLFVQNYDIVITMTQARTTAQTLAAIHDDRTAQPYSATNGLGALTNLFLTGAGASFSGVTPTQLTPTTYATATLANYQANINYGSSASFGTTTFGNGTATPLASAVNFLNVIEKANSSTEPPKRLFERQQQNGSTINPLDPAYANYNVNTNPTALNASFTSSLLVPSYLSDFTVPAPYANTTQWVQGFTVTAAMVAANGGQPLTAGNFGTYSASGVFTPTQFGVGSYVPGIGTAPRPYRVSSAVNVPTLLQQIENTTDPYADGAFPSGHTNAAYLQALGLAFLVPQQAQELVYRASNLGNDRILAGMHSPFDVIGGRIEAEAIAATNIYGALYDSNGNFIDWTNPANTNAYAVYQAYTQTQSYLAGACGTATVAQCIQAAQASGATASDPYAPSAANKATYTADLTYGFAATGPVAALTDAQVPVQAQVLLLTRFPYLSDAQRTDILATTSNPTPTPIASGNTWDGWGQLNLYAAYGGYGAFNSTVTVNMDASLGGYNASDSWTNDISGAGGLIKTGTGTLLLTGQNSFSGGITVQGGTLAGAASSFGTGPVTDNATLLFSEPASENFAPAISGTGVLQKTGTGDLILDGSSPFSGSTDVQEGRLAVNGSLAASAVTVESGATLGGSGTVGTVAIDAGGILAPGNSIGTVTVAGNLTLAPGAVYQVQVNPAGASDRTAVAGTATLTGAILQIQEEDGTYGRQTLYPILSAQGGVTGQFAGVSSDLAFLVPGLNYSATGVTLALTRNDVQFGQIAATANQAGPADAISQAGFGTPLYTAVVGLSDASARQAFTSLSGQIYASLGSVVLNASQDTRQAVTARLRQGFADATPAAAALAPTGVQAAPGPVLTVWTQPLGSWGGFNATSNTAGVTSSTGGVLFGADGRLNNRILIGTYIGTSSTSMDVHGGLGTANIKSTQFGLYGATQVASVSVRLGAGYEWNDATVKRQVGFPGFASNTKASLAPNAGQVFGELADELSLGPVAVEPFAGLAWVSQSGARFAETGSAGLTGHLAGETTEFSTLGARVAHGFTVGAVAMTARAELGWRHAFGDTVPVSTASLLEGAGTFSETGAPIARNAAVTDIGLDAAIGHGASLGLGYAGQFGGAVRDNAIRANVTVAF
jgi:outer membrane autotransporter protein